jgi:hypothetical protein
MNRLGLGPDEPAAYSRQATAANRETWAEMGFRNFTTKVHDNDRALVLAELEVRKFARMSLLTEDKNTDQSVLRIIASRNMYKRPDKTEIDACAKRAENSKERDRVIYFLKESTHYHRKYTNVKNNYDPEAKYAARIRMEAKAVAFMNTSVAYYQLAELTMQHGEMLSIFGVVPDRGSDDV